MKTLSSLLLTVGLMFCNVVNANIMVWLDPQVQPTSGNGDTVSLTLMVGGLGDFAPSSLSGFDIDIVFNPNVLSFTGYNLLGGLGDLAAFEADDFSGGEYAAGMINLAELSYLFDDQLDALQPSMFALAEMFFHVDALAIGEFTTLSLNVNDFSDNIGGSFNVDVVGNAVVSANLVPSPTPYLLFGFALLAMMIRKNSVKSMH